MSNEFENDALSSVFDPATAERVRAFQKRLVDIQLGQAEMPSWFRQTGFDTADVIVDGIGTFQICAATAGTMEALDRATDKTESILEQNAMIEGIESIPEGLTNRRPIKLSKSNKRYEAGTHFVNLWDVYGDKPDMAREILSQLVTGKLYTLLKLGVMWLSKIDMKTVIESDPEVGKVVEAQT